MATRPTVKYFEFPPDRNKTLAPSLFIKIPLSAWDTKQIKVNPNPALRMAVTLGVRKMLRERKLRKDIKDIICKRIPPAAVLARKCVHSIMQSNRHAVPFTLPALGQVRAQACRETHLQTRRLIQIECTIDKCICVL